MKLADAIVACIWIAAAGFALAAEAQALSARQEEGLQAYRAHCRYCHLEHGTGTMMLERRLGKENALLEQRTNLETGYVRAVVRGGLKSMPALTRVEVTDAELDAIAAYLTRTNPQAQR
jgi:mono/diheme cytochrome c family protein